MKNRGIMFAALGILVGALLYGCGDGNTRSGRPETGFGAGGDSVGPAGAARESTETKTPGGK